MIPNEKACSWCRQIKPASAFSVIRKRGGEPRLHGHCKACRNDRAKMRLRAGLRKDRPKPGRMGETNPGAWKWPRDDRPVREKLADAALREWGAARPVTGVLAPSLGVRA